ncbi:MAG: TolC family protein [Ferruginibacter sp.]
MALRGFSNTGMRVKNIMVISFLLTGSFCFGQNHDLSFFIQQAHGNSPIIKSYQNQVLSNQLDSQILAASLKTQLNFISNDYYAPVVKGWGYDEAITNIASLQGLVQASRNFLSKGHLAAQYLGISLQSRSLRDSLLLSAKDLQKTITDQYITAYGDMLTMNYTKELFDILQQEDVILKKLAQSSVIKQTEYLAFDITMQQQELNYLQAQIQYNADYLALNYLAGINDTTITTLDQPVISGNVPNDFYHSVFYQRYTTDSLRIANERRLIDYSYRPSIGAYSDAGYNSSLQYLPYKNFGFSVGVSIKVPLYDANQKRFKYQKLDIEERTRQSNRNFFLQQYNQQLAQLNNQLHSTELLFQKINKQVTYTKTLMTAYEKLLQTGDVKVTEFVTAVTNYVNAQNAYRQNSISRLKIMSQVNYWNQ